MNTVFSELFVTQVRQMSKDEAQAIHGAVNAILAKPSAHDNLHHYPWDGCFEKKVGARRIVYCICGECRQKGVDGDHPECKARPNETVVFRMIYTVF